MEQSGIDHDIVGDRPLIGVRSEKNPRHIRLFVVSGTGLNEVTNYVARLTGQRLTKKGCELLSRNLGKSTETCR